MVPLINLGRWFRVRWWRGFSPARRANRPPGVRFCSGNRRPRRHRPRLHDRDSDVGHLGPISLSTRRCAAQTNPQHWSTAHLLQHSETEFSRGTDQPDIDDLSMSGDNGNVSSLSVRLFTASPAQVRCPILRRFPPISHVIAGAAISLLPGRRPRSTMFTNLASNTQQRSSPPRPRARYDPY
jgi:hypothetical protein